MLHVASLLVFNTITLYSGMFSCLNCQRMFSLSRSPPIHCYTCHDDNNYTHMPSSSTTSKVNSTKHHSTNKTPINNILQ